MTIFVKNLSDTSNFKDFLLEKVNYFDISSPFLARDQ